MTVLELMAALRKTAGETNLNNIPVWIGDDDELGDIELIYEEDRVSALVLWAKEKCK